MGGVPTPKGPHWSTGVALRAWCGHPKGHWGWPRPPLMGIKGG
jgi:hypothetical protein